MASPAVLLFVSFICFNAVICSAVIVTPEDYFPYAVCDYSGAGNFTSAGATSLETLLSSISSTNSINSGFLHLSEKNPPGIEVIGLCQGDLGADVCRSCLKISADAITQSCPVQKEAILWYLNCSLRYSTRSIYGDLSTIPSRRLCNAQNFSDVNRQFYGNLVTLLQTLRTEAAAGGSLRKVAAKIVRLDFETTLHVLVQCTPDLSQDQCDACLMNITSEMLDYCVGRRGGIYLAPSCTARYETYPFFDEISESLPPAPPPTSPKLSVPPLTSATTVLPPAGSKTFPRWGIIVIVIAFLCLLFFIIFIAVCMVKKRNRGTTNGEESVPKEGVMMALKILQLDFQAIKAATGNFSDSNKLGKGGFGAVYKGMLPDGQEIAVKRLFSANYENEDSVFANEAMLLAKLRHKNLVSLIGYCCEGPERLLIFELMSNSSLDHFIFGHADHAPLDWERRYAIITGVARGLLYLHEDSPEQIIHLDIKAANILLDAEMNPKIADFGLARLFGLDKTHTYATKVAGTRGYMAPEYLLENIVSVKADVFSFGVLILEIVSGRRVHTEEGSLLSHAWNKWREGTEQEIVDLHLSSTSMSEIRTCIHVALLCVQEDRNDRPMMGSVVSMLYRRAPPLQMPSKPGYVQLQPTHDLPWNTVPKAQPKRLMRSASANDGRGVTS